MLKIAMEHLSERQRVRAELQQNIANLLVAAKANDAKVPRLCGAKVFGQIRVWLICNLVHQTIARLAKKVGAILS